MRKSRALAAILIVSVLPEERDDLDKPGIRLEILRP